jgi:hypothetical protein
MRHVPSSVLRRQLDEPFAAPDTARRHLATCGHCRASSGEIAENAALAVRLLAPPQIISDPGLAWAQLRRQLAEPLTTTGATRIPWRPDWQPTRRLVNAAISSGAAVAFGVLLAGVGAAATLSTVFAPNRVAPVTVSRADVRAIAGILGAGAAQLPGDAAPAAGLQQLPFGTLQWTSAGHARRVATLAQAAAITHLAYSPPATLPAGVGSVRSIVAQPMVTATIRFSPGSAAPVGGSSLAVTGGPAMLVQYRNSAGTAGLTTLGIATMQRPVASSTGATTSQLEAFLLSRPGVPADLAGEIRLLGNLKAILPVPIPAGVAAQHVQIDGSPGIAISDASGAASGVIWESRGGIVHVVTGLLDRKDVLSVARQIG